MPTEVFARLELAGNDSALTARELQRMLGRFGFQWLCACAVYPRLRFPLSVHLGRCLAEAVGRPPPDEDEHLALFHLPWFRSGWMPEDLRLALIRRLEPELRPVVRTAIEALLFNALDDDRRDPDAAPRLDFARPPQGWQAALRAWMEGSPAGTPARDTIFVEYMMGRVPKPADLWLNRRLARLFGAKVAGWFDRRTIIWSVLAIGTSVAVWSVADTVIRSLFTPGLSHMSKELEEEIFAPHSGAHFAADGSGRRMQAQDVLRQPSDDGVILWSVVLAGPGVVFVEDNIEGPVQVVLDGPMGAGDGEARFRLERARQPR